MPRIFISYRREDCSGEAGRLAEDLIRRYGRASVFIDIDAIPAGRDFEQSIDQALGACQVAFVMIGQRWLTAALPAGGRRLDDPGDYVRREIAAALTRGDVAVVPVLVEGARMPAAAELPQDIAGLSRLQAFELSSKRWRYDLGQLLGVVASYDRSWRRQLRRVPRWAVRSGLGFALAGALAAIIILATSGSAGTPSRGSSPRRAILVPASVPPVVDECSQQLTFAVDGTAGPLQCRGGALNSLAWQYYAKFNPLIMTLGRSATPGQVLQALCADLRTNHQVTVPIETESYHLSIRYYGWHFVLAPDPATLSC